MYQRTRGWGGGGGVPLVHDPPPPRGGWGMSQGYTTPTTPPPGTLIPAPPATQNGPLGSGRLAGSGSAEPARHSRAGVTVSSAVLARSLKPGKAGFGKRLDRIQVQPGLGRAGCTGLGGVDFRVRDGTERDGTGRDGTGRNGTGRERDGRDGTDEWGRLNVREDELARPNVHPDPLASGSG